MKPFEDRVLTGFPDPGRFPGSPELSLSHPRTGQGSLERAKPCRIFLSFECKNLREIGEHSFFGFSDCGRGRKGCEAKPTILKRPSPCDGFGNHM